MTVLWKNRKPKPKHHWPRKSRCTPEVPDFTQTVDEHTEYVLYPQKHRLLPTWYGYVGNTPKYRDEHDKLLQQQRPVDPDLYQPNGMYNPLKVHDWVERDLKLRQVQIDDWLAEQTVLKNRSDQPPPELAVKKHDYAVMPNLVNKLPPGYVERQYPVERRPFVAEQKKNIEQATMYQYELQLTYAKFFVADAMCPRGPNGEDRYIEEELDDEYVHDRDMNFHHKNLNACVKELKQVTKDIKAEEGRLNSLEHGIFDTDQNRWAQSKHWEIPEDAGIEPPVGLFHISAEDWRQRAEQVEEQEEAVRAAAKAASLWGRTKAGVRAFNAVVDTDVMVTACGGVRPSRRNTIRKRASSEGSQAAIKLTQQTTTSAAVAAAAESAILSSPGSRSSGSLSWHSSMATVASSLDSSTAPAPIPDAGEEPPPAKGSLPQGTQPIDIALPDRIARARVQRQLPDIEEVTEGSSIPQGTQPIDITLPNQFTPGRGLLRRCGNFKQLDTGLGGAEETESPPESLLRSSLKPSSMWSAGATEHCMLHLSKSGFKKQVRFAFDDDDDECAIIDEEEEVASQVEDRIDEPDQDEDDDENKENEGEDAIQEEENDDDPADDSDNESIIIPDDMIRGQILRKPGSPPEDEPEDPAYEGDIDSSEVKPDQEEHETRETDEDMDGRPPSPPSSTEGVIDSDSDWETVAGDDSDEEASDEEASDDEQEEGG